LRDESRVIVFENRVLKKISEPKRKYVTGESRRLYNEDFE
jgi:hypothetical protein